ncbi:endoglucanase 3 [Hordeum vulgare]|nr:endoglucanase 3 [Hordeum vulgare]
MHGPTELLYDYLMRWTELHNSCEGAHDVQENQYFIDGCRDGTLLKRKLMHRETMTLAHLMSIVDEYTMAESSMKLLVLVDAAGKPTLAKPVVARQPADPNRIRASAILTIRIPAMAADRSPPSRATRWMTVRAPAGVSAPTKASSPRSPRTPSSLCSMGPQVP